MRKWCRVGLRRSSALRRSDKRGLGNRRHGSTAHWLARADGNAGRSPSDEALATAGQLPEIRARFGKPPDGQPCRCRMKDS